MYSLYYPATHTAERKKENRETQTRDGGGGLFIPRGWWHQVRASAGSVAMSIPESRERRAVAGRSVSKIPPEHSRANIHNTLHTGVLRDVIVADTHPASLTTLTY